MREIRTSGLMSGEGKRGAHALPRLSSTLLRNLAPPPKRDGASLSGNGRSPNRLPVCAATPPRVLTEFHRQGFKPRSTTALACGRAGDVTNVGRFWLRNSERDESPN
jgi:hypothetical protein